MIINKIKTHDSKFHIVNLQVSYHSTCLGERGRLSPYVVVANVLDCDIIVSEFEIQSCYYVYFWMNKLRKGTYSLSFGLNSMNNIL